MQAAEAFEFGWPHLRDWLVKRGWKVSGLSYEDAVWWVDGRERLWRVTREFSGRVVVSRGIRTWSLPAVDAAAFLDLEAK